MLILPSCMQVVAVLKFSGYATKEICSDSCRALQDRLKAGANVLAWIATELPHERI